MRASLESLIAHAGSASVIRSLPRRPAVLAMRSLTAVGLAPFAPYHWLLYGESLWFDTTKAREELGWQARWSNADMLADSYDWFIAHRDSLAAAEGRSHHRSPVRQGALRLLRWLG
jgi:nucleoside-diphosphate-sugar epimerase